jgi:transitional endoplasmic reticulum ATPase
MSDPVRQLTVIEGVGVPRGGAMVAPATLAALGCAGGDAVQIHGARTTVARISPWPADHPAAREKDAAGTIAMDGLTRQNAGALLGDAVTVQRVAAPAAASVALVPAAGSPALSEAELRQVGRALRGQVVVAGDLVRVPGLGAVREFQVLATNPASAVALEPGTIMRLQPTGSGVAPHGSHITYEDIGGLGRELQHVRELIELPLKHPEVFERLGIEAPKGVLLHGPPGTGKTLIARAVASESSAKFHSISGPEIIGKYYGESEAQLRRVFEQAQRHAPSVVFIDEIDAIAPKRSEVYGEVEKRVVTQLLALMDGIAARGQVIVIGATNRPDALDPALRRPGRFDREIALHAPDARGRLEILRIHSLDMPLAADVDLVEIARITPGFVGADLTALCREAAMAALRRTFPGATLIAGRITLDELLGLAVTMEDFRTALAGLEPSAAREVAVEIGQVTWDDIGGLHEIKRTLVETIEWPLRYPDIYSALGLGATRGVLLTGLPGTGKTLIARALATACQANFISVKGPELLSRWVGESERGVRETFARARQVAPCVLFLDELDALAPARGNSFDAVSDRIIGQLLTELDGIEGRRGVIVVGATNRPELIDDAVLRPGRFDLLLELPLPDRTARKAIYAIHTRGRPLGQGIALDNLARKSEGLSGADIEAVCRRAAQIALGDWLRERDPKTLAALTPADLTAALVIQPHHFDRALADIRAKG